MRSRRLFAVLFAAVAVVLLGTAPAFAHTSLTKSDPAQGATLSAVPTRVSLTFAEAVGLPSKPITITGPAGAAWTVGQATVSGATVTAPVTATGPAGAYAMTWTVIADDGDTIRGTVRFTMAVAPTPPATTAPVTTPPATTAPATTAVATVVPRADAAATQDGGVPGWVWLVVVLAVVLLGGGAALAARSRRG